MKPFSSTPSSARREPPINLMVIVFLALLFAFSSLDKVFHYHQFVNAVRNYSLVPHGMARYIALPLIIVEMLIAGGLLYRPWRRTAALAGLAAMIVFTAALLTNWIYGERGICGCWFTMTLAQGNLAHILQDVLFAGLFASVLFVSPAVGSMAAPSHHQPLHA